MVLQINILFQNFLALQNAQISVLGGPVLVILQRWVEIINHGLKSILKIS